MSVIWGVIHNNGKAMFEKTQQQIMNKLDIYRLDSIKSWYKNNVFLGCGLQYITAESLQEVLPYYDKKSRLAVTADAIIDNREELFELLNVSMNNRNKITDSELILESFKKWGTNCPKYLVGDFAFAIWDEKRNELFCARDHVGTRTFYYYYNNNTFVFCTVIKPIFEILDNKPDLNERWVTDFLALPVVVHESECCETIYSGIYQLPPAYAITINNFEIKKEQYWDPIKEVKPLKLKTDNEYEEAFRKVFFEAVRCRTRTFKDVGVMLSGGMDSGSVACVAAMQLAKKNKILKAFSSIPMLKFKDNSPKFNVANESEYIESISKTYDNIYVNYCRSEEKNSLTNIDFFIDVLEQPHKIIENLFWFDELTKTAANQNCKVLLNGSYGNMTISYGDYIVHTLTLFREKKLVKLWVEINEFSKIFKVRKYRVIKAIAKAIVPYNLRKFIGKRKYRNYDCFDMVPANINLLDKWNVKERLKKKGYFLYPDIFYDIKEMRRYMLNPTIFTQIGAIETKISLAHGIVMRDPTRDKRVIEFCLSIPYDQFVRNGRERYLIYRSMKGILPDKIRLNSLLRGLQSADWIQRLQPEWRDIYNQLEYMLSDESIENYIDVDKLKKELVSIGEKLEEEKSTSIRMLLVSLIMSHFIKDYNNREK
ncbi:asparagine synthase [Clostridiaceae bacterium UIB06]|uniref:asparagine synthase (glutamine-hydrolyzing) n=1 Tax=Clostridium thailandense TaxID=2794346 RepID=A0A949TTG8_9CLOT|nr:asparagine synthase-related protein [Clostridium thailandense]MBV7276197.1 asparagine synthase [Clostridium thailandense]MCH5138226.1 asparagine synthase [Clostridiaceae bacterium UIB06]